MLQRPKNGGPNYTFCQILPQNRGGIRYFPHFSSNIGVETIQIFQRPEKRGSKWRSICSNLHILSTLPGLSWSGDWPSVYKVHWRHGVQGPGFNPSPRQSKFLYDLSCVLLQAHSFAQCSVYQREHGTHPFCNETHCQVSPCTEDRRCELCFQRTSSSMISSSIAWQSLMPVLVVARTTRPYSRLAYGERGRFKNEHTLGNMYRRKFVKV